MKRPVPLVAIAIATFCVLPVPHATAQDYLGNHIAAQQEQRMLENMQDNVQGPKKTRKPVAKPVQSANANAPGARGAAAVLRPYAFVPDAAVSRRVNGSVAAVLAGGAGSTGSSARLLGDVVRGQPAFGKLLAAQLGGDRAAMQARLDAGALQQAFRKGIARYGYSDRNLADVNNAYLLHAWALVNDRNIDGPRPYAAQRARFLEGARTSAAPAADDATKQEISETLALVVMLSGKAWNAGGAQERQALRSGLLAMGRSLGLDLSSARLTNEGLVTR